MALQPWYKVVTPREDLREGRPLDASEFAVHLDQVRDERAPAVYQNPKEFFERTYMTESLTGLSAEVVRRLAGEKTETSAVFNLATQFGGGKTHALTLLYHLAQHGPSADDWRGVRKILEKAGIRGVPRAATAVFVGTEFDSLTGRGGSDGTPMRRTPWGEIAYQLGGEGALATVAEHEKRLVAPAGDVIRRFLPRDRPCLILMDELMNYVSRYRKMGLSSQLYDFLQNLSETVRGMDRAVLAVSIPASELEMTSEDQGDYDRFKKLLDRVGKAVFMSAETETSEIIRRRLFEWGGLHKDGRRTVAEYADWTVEHRQQIPSWFPVDRADEAFSATYPFHPSVISVFERKWQSLPRFQRTRGVLRLLALWVSRAYQEGYRGAHRDPLITLGSAPLDDPTFRAAVFEQLGEAGLEVAVTTDITGKSDSHAVRLDSEAVDTIKKARLHRKVATTVFFESNGGQMRAEATLPEVRLDVGEPGLDIGNVETVLETLGNTCYYLTVERNRYRFSLSPNLNKILSDRLATIQTAKVDEQVRQEVQRVFGKGPGVERVFFPERSNQIPDRPALTFVVLAPDQVIDKNAAAQMIETMTREYGTSARTYKSGLIWCVPEPNNPIRNEARKLLAWEEIGYEQEDLRLDEGQKRQLPENLKKARRDLSESIWQGYKNVMLLGKDNSMRQIDLGLVHSSAAESLIGLVLNHLRMQDEVTEHITPHFLVRNWPPAFREWSTKSVRDAFFASPQFPRLLSPEAVRQTIATGVQNNLLAYVGKSGNDEYGPFYFGDGLSPYEVEISDDMFIITRETADSYVRSKAAATAPPESPRETAYEPTTTGGAATGIAETTQGWEAVPTTQAAPTPNDSVQRLTWSGEVPWQKLTTFYMKVLSRYSGNGVKLTLNVDISPQGGLSPQQIEETKAALRELGLEDDVRTQ